MTFDGCKECGCFGTHRGTCSQSQMRGGTPGLGVGRIAFGHAGERTILPLESQAVVGDRIYDMHTREQIGRVPRFVDAAAIRAVRREMLLLARSYRRHAHERPDRGGAPLGAAAAYRDSAGRLRGLLP